MMTGAQLQPLVACMFERKGTLENDGNTGKYQQLSVVQPSYLGVGFAEKLDDKEINVLNGNRPS